MFTSSDCLAGQLSNRGQNLIGLWHLNDGLGTQVQDSTDGGATGTFGGTSPIWATGKFGQSLKFSNLVFNYVTFANESRFDFAKADPFYIVAWTKFTAQSAGGWVVSKMAGTGTLAGWILGHSTFKNGDVYMRVQNASNSRCEKATANAYPDNGTQWHLLIGWWDGTNDCDSGIGLYVDGSSVPLTNGSSGTGINNEILNNAGVSLSGNGSAGIVGGYIDEVAIYRGKITLEDAKRIYGVFNSRRMSESSEN